MKLMFASDLHGSAYYGRKMLEIYEKSGASQLIFLGDILYHGPRNDLPREYAPKEVIAMLNPLKNQILSVRGNCDTEVDQMVLEFPILADYGFLMVDGIRIYATHGHIFHENHLPPVQDGDVLIHGHTHILEAKEIQAEDGRRVKILNPGSVSIPKGGNPNTYAILEDGLFSILDLEGNAVRQIRL